MKPLTTRGSLDNVPLLEAGTIEIGLVFGEMVQELFNPKDRPPTKLKVITTAYSSESTVENTLSSLPRLDVLQGGVELYYREIGAIK